MKKVGGDKSIGLYSGRSVMQPFEVVSGENGKPFIKVADHFIVKEMDGSTTKHPGHLKTNFHIGIPTYQDYIQKILKNSELNAPNNKNQRKAIIRKMESFFSSYSGLVKYLSTPHGNIPISAEDADLFATWHNYLFCGRELIDEIGRCLHICAGLDDRLKGLNKNRLESLSNKIEQMEKHGRDVSDKLYFLLGLKDFIITFIAARNHEKKSRTIVEAPLIYPDGEPKGGEITFLLYDDRMVEYDFVKFITVSYQRIIDLLEHILK